MRKHFEFIGKGTDTKHFYIVIYGVQKTLDSVRTFTKENYII